MLATLFLAAAASTKNEGLPIGLIMLAVAAAVVGRRPDRPRRAIAAAAGGFVLCVLPWHIWLAAHSVPADPNVPLSKAVHFGYLFDRTSRIWPSLQAIGHQLADQGTWSYLIPLGAAVALACVLKRVAWRAAIFYLATAVLIVAVYTYVYWLRPLEIDGYLASSAFRVIDPVVFVALAAALQLPSAAQRDSHAAKPDEPLRQPRIPLLDRPPSSSGRTSPRREPESPHTSGSRAVKARSPTDIAGLSQNGPAGPRPRGTESPGLAAESPSSRRDSAGRRAARYRSPRIGGSRGARR